MSVRKLHRTISVLFTVTVIASVVGAALGAPEWLFYLPLLPLVLLLLTGTYLFVLPYAAKRRATS